MATTNLLVVSDLHINSTVGLCPPGVELDDGGTYQPSPGQKWLWRNWQDFWKRAGELPGRKIVVFNGDIAELDTKRRSVQIITGNKATILDMVHNAIEPAVQIADSVIVIRGTQAHVGKGAWVEEEIARDLDNAVDNESLYHARLNVDGVRIDIAHHANMSRNPWLKNNAANALASKLLWYYKVDQDRKPPHLAIRSHNHRSAVGYARGGPDELEVRYTGAWTLATEFTYRLGGENDLADIGGLLVKIEPGATFETQPILYPYREKGITWKTI